MTDNGTTELRISEPLRGFIKHQSNRAYIDGGQARWLTKIADEIDAKHEQAIADELNAALGRIDEPDTIRNELADGGLIADVLAPVCVNEKERMAFERGRIRERFAQQIFKEATS